MVMRTTTTPPPPKDLDKVRLKDILLAYAGTSGVAKLLVMVRLRDYLKRQDPEIVMDEIRTIDDEQDINVLIGAGAHGQLYYAVLAQRARLDGLM